ncbi:hypothetical protein CPB84DRAFT_1959176 [Gymnopilus junonius]|uniref:Uncharacterized protein n=1 Tax=Gymnopilus junonius TaxID=109634 RepID=A0A9P5TSX4_GYMJU|nr:hypothetical protein CPB84DRAFT_1959176 [Gymnopilus junonius]
MPASERLFVDLIVRSSHKYPNWDPEVSRKKPIGVFLKEGNIYEEGIAEKYDIPKPVEHGVDSTEGTTWVTSRNAQQVSVDADIAGQTPALVECSVKASFKFNSNKGAVLAMDNDTILTISPPGKLRRLLAAKELQKGYVIVSEVHRCSSYARFLSSSAGATVALGLSAQPPMADVGSAKVDAKWVHSSSAGNFKARVNKEGKRVFYPLFRLVALKESSVSTGLRGELDEDPPLPDVEPPWDPVEDGGEEQHQAKAV